MKLKRILLSTIMTSSLLFSVGALTSCNENKSLDNSIVDLSVNEAGDVIAVYSDGTQKSIGNVNGKPGTDGTDGKDGVNGKDGADGKDGVSIENAYVNDNGELIVKLSNGTEINGGVVASPSKLYLNKSAEFNTGFTSEEGGVAEIVKYNKDNSKVYLVNGLTKTLDIVSLTINSKNSLKRELETVFDENTDRIDFNKIVEENSSSFEEGFKVGDITSVTVNTDNKYVAVALQHSEYDKNGSVVLLDYDGGFITAYKCGIQPDMITYTGKLLLTADEGEPRKGYVDASDPKGSVTVIDLSNGINNGVSKIVDFTSFDEKREELVNNGVLIKKESNPSLDFEPEYITTDNKYAYVSLQEANAIAKLNLETKEFESVSALGFKNHNEKGNGLDLLADDKIVIENQNVYGVYMPDGIDAFTMNGETYIATANEGDAREWAEYSGVGKTTINGTKVETLDNSKWDGLDATKTYILGGRSFSIFKASDMSLVYDSNEQIEKNIALSEYSDYFNCSNSDLKLDSRSKKKGPEPETIIVREINNKYYAFVGLERISGVMTFDITDFLNGNVKYNGFTSSRDYSVELGGDVAPEGLDFISSELSPNEKNILIVANENSGTISFYNIEDSNKEYNIHQSYTKKEASVSDHLLIYSAYGSGGNIDGAVSHNYIAIKNPTSLDIDLSNYRLEYTQNGTITTAWQSLSLTGTIKAGEVFIVRGSSANTTSAAFNITSYDMEWSDLSISNKTFSIRLINNDTIVDALGVDSDGLNTESYEGSPVIDLSKQKILIRKNDNDNDNNYLDYEIISFKDLTPTSEIVIQYLEKLGL